MSGFWLKRAMFLQGSILHAVIGLTAWSMVSSAAFVAAEEAWLTEMDVALEKARAESKSVLVDFTGSDWCIWCQRLDQEVFETAEFLERSREDFVLVKLDFPRDDSGLSETQKQHHATWKKRLSVNGFPTVYLLDDQGRPFAKTGYAPGGVEPYLQQLKALNQRREQRDALLRQAESLEGAERAAKLDEALSVMDDALVTGYYDDVIAEIGRLDPNNESGIRAKYFAAQDEEYRRSLMAKVRLAERTLSPQAAARTIQLVLDQQKLPPSLQLEAMRIRWSLLRELGQQDEQLAVIEQMIALEGLSPNDYQELLSLKALQFVAMDRLEDALGLLEDRIQSTLENRELYLTRGELLLRVGRFSEALNDLEHVENSIDPASERRVELALAQSDCWMGLERPDEAFRVLDQVAAVKAIDPERRAEALLQKASLLREQGQSQKAAAAEQAALQLSDDPAVKARIQALIDVLKD